VAWDAAPAQLASRSKKPVEKAVDVPSPLTPFRFGDQQCSWKTVKTELDDGNLLFDHRLKHRTSILRAECAMAASQSSGKLPGRRLGWTQYREAKDDVVA